MDPPPNVPERPPDPDGDRPIRLTRRRFLVEAAALVGAGAIAGATVVAVGGPGRTAPPVPTPSPAPSPAQSGTGPSSAGTQPAGSPPAAATPTASPAFGSAPPGVLPTPSGATLEPIESAPPVGPARVVHENQRRGSSGWELPVHGKGTAEAYASDVSVAAGETIEFRVSSSHARGTLTLYRLGWYGGKGARVIERWPDVPLTLQAPPTTDATTGMIRAPWTATVTATVPDSWVSGIYLLVVSPSGGAPQYATFVVREARPLAPILFVSSTTTYQAYNAWGGKSLYPDESTGAPTVSGGTNAVIASWDRPYGDYRGGGLVLRWEYPFLRWLESREYDVAYVTDLDLERRPELVAGRRLVLTVGHSEYWSVPMRATLEQAIAAGTNVAFLSANNIYWRVRFDPSASTPYRTVTCYRDAAIDPIAASDPAATTVKWRDLPSKRPESLLIGQMYGHVVLVPADFVCTAPDHWLYAGTGMQSGDAIARLIGQEYDRFWPDRLLSPVGTQVLAVSPVQPNLGHEIQIYGGPAPDETHPAVHNATIYTAPSGATVFSAGTMQWAWGLDDWGGQQFEGVRTPVDPRVARMTANLLDRLGS